MSEIDFLQYYIKLNQGKNGNDSYIISCRAMEKRMLSKLPELPLSHIYVASQLYDKMPLNSVVHLGILSPLRSWSYFNFHPSLEVYCNQGGFGIDGNMSSAIGASLIHPERLYYIIVGDLSFFYDINVLGNRHVGNNVRILLINNALGAEFHLFKQQNCTCVNDISKYLSAGGHFGNKSPQLVRHYADDLGYEYFSASTKEEFLQVYKHFVTPEITKKPMIFEVFTNVEDENEALKRMWEIEADIDLKREVKQVVKNVLGDAAIVTLKKMLHK